MSIPPGACGFCGQLIEVGEKLEKHKLEMHWESMQPARHPKSQEFHNILKEMGALHDQKQRDYGRPDDPFANVRASADFGIPAWIGAVVRANDKMRRLQTAAQGSQLSNEGVEDSLLDLAVYAIIGLILYREEGSNDNI